MAEQRDYRMPETGEGWRHWKGGLYTVVGMSNHHDTGEPLVVYTPFGWGLAQLPPLHVRPLAEFIAEVVLGDTIGVGRKWTQRFVFERNVGCDPECAYIRKDFL